MLLGLPCTGCERTVYSDTEHVGESTLFPAYCVVCQEKEPVKKLVKRELGNPENNPITED